MLYLTESEVAELLVIEDAIGEVERALRGYGEGWVVNNPRRRLRLPQSLLMSLEAGDASTGYVGHKNYLAVPGHDVLSHFFLYDSGQRALVAMMQANELGRVRTSATSAVAAKYLARHDATRYAVFGAGFQAETQVEAICRVRPIRQVRVWSRTREQVEGFCRRLSARLNTVVLEPALGDPAELAAWGDIITVATRASEPVLRGDWLQRGVFVNAVGANALDRSEIDVEVSARADQVVVDSLEGARLESGDLLPAIEQGHLRWEQVRELGAVVAGLTPGRVTDEQILLFESHGLGLEDLAVGSYVYHKAIAAGAGHQLAAE